MTPWVLTPSMMPKHLPLGHSLLITSHERLGCLYLASQCSQFGDKITSGRRGAVVFPLLLQVREGTPLGYKKPYFRQLCSRLANSCWGSFGIELHSKVVRGRVGPYRIDRFKCTNRAVSEFMISVSVLEIILSIEHSILPCGFEVKL